MSEQAREMLMSIDVKKHRFRIQRPILQQLGNPKRVQLLFNYERHGIMIMRISQTVPISQSLKVSFDKPGSDGCFELYSLSLLKDLQKWDKRLEGKGLYHLNGHAVPELEAICFPLTTLRKANNQSTRGKNNDNSFD
jgi:hypothetical protein